VLVERVGADRHVHGQRDRPLRRAGEEAQVRARRLGVEEEPAQGFSEAQALRHALVHRAVHEGRGLFHHPELPGTQGLFDGLGSVAPHRDLEVVDRGRAVHRQRGEGAAIE